VVNNGIDTIETISINLRSPEGYLLDILNDRLEVSLQGVKGKFGAGNLDTTYNVVHVYSSGSLNTLPVIIPVGGGLKITLKLVNFPAYGLQSSPIEAEFDITPNAGAVSVPPLSAWPDSGVHWDPQNEFQWVTKDPASSQILLNPYRIRVGSRIFNSDLRVPITAPDSDVFLVISGNGIVTLEPQSGFELPDGSLKVAKISLVVNTGVIESYEPLVPLSTPPYFLEPSGALEDARFVQIGPSGLLELGGSMGVSVGSEGYFVGLGPAIVKTSVDVSEGDKLGSNAQGEAILDPEGSITALKEGLAGTRILVWVGPKGGSGGSFTQDPTNLGSSRTSSQYALTSSTGSGANLLGATQTLAGLMVASDKTKLDGIAPGAQVNVPSNLSGTPGASSYQIGNSNGTGVTISIAGAQAGLMSPSDKSKLDGIASGAQVNAPTNLSGAPGVSTILLSSSTGSSYTIPAATTSQAGLMTAADKTALNSSGATNLSITQETLGLGLQSSTGTDVTIPRAVNLSGAQVGLVSKTDVDTWNAKQNAITTPGSGAKLISGSFMKDLVAGSGVTITPDGNNVILSSSGKPIVGTANQIIVDSSGANVVISQASPARFAKADAASGNVLVPIPAGWTLLTFSSPTGSSCPQLTATGDGRVTVNTAGIYSFSFNGLLSTPNSSTARVLCGLSAGGALLSLGYTLVNATMASTDNHINTMHTVSVTAGTTVGFAIYVDLVAAGPLNLSCYSFTGYLV
jgi:hypothetical protein